MQVQVSLIGVLDVRSEESLADLRKLTIADMAVVLLNDCPKINKDIKVMQPQQQQQKGSKG